MIIDPREQVSRFQQEQSEHYRQMYRNVSLTPTHMFIGNWKLNDNYERSDAQKANAINLKDNKHANELSHKARKRIMYGLNWLYASAKYKPVWSEKDRKTFYFKINFITLTIPSTTGEIIPRHLCEASTIIDDREVINEQCVLLGSQYSQDLVNEKLFQKCLNTWLTYARKYFGLGNYMWKVEAQKNGQLHIHLSADQFIHHRRIRDSWNRILQSNGLLDAYFNKYNNYSPNSTDVHSTKKMYNAIAYIGGYMKKNPNFTKQYNGRIWGCSSGLSEKNKCSIKMDYYASKELAAEVIKHEMEWKEVMTKSESPENAMKLGTLVMLKKNQYKQIQQTLVKSAYSKHIKYIQSLTKIMPKEYYVIDLFGERTKLAYEKQSETPTNTDNPPPIIIPQQIEIWEDYANESYIFDE